MFLVLVIIIVVVIPHFLILFLVRLCARLYGLVGCGERECIVEVEQFAQTLVAILE